MPNDRIRVAFVHGRESTAEYFKWVFENAPNITYESFIITETKSYPKGFDLYFRLDHGDYADDLPENLHPAAWYLIDTHFPKTFKTIRKQVRHYDFVFCAQKEGAEKVRKSSKVDAQWVPLACDPEIHQKLNLPKIYNIGFVGRDAQKFARGRHLAYLKKAYPQHFIGRADHREMGKIYSQSKIGFNSSVKNDINLRVFEVMSSGCFLLTNAIKNNGFEELFEDRKHLVVYRNDKEMVELLEYYLTHEKEREEIAAAGHALVVSQYTYFHRVQSMFNYIAFKLGGKYNNLRI